MRIFKIIPLDSKGEQDGAEWVTQYEEVAMDAFVQGYSVSMAEVVGWTTVTFKAVEVE
jgi:hypothetical protein